jgi:prevent-host-death family protein
MSTRVNLADAKARLSAVVDDVRRTANRYLVVRHGKPAAAIVTVEDLARLDESDRLGASPAGALALVGLWADVDDAAIDEFLRDIYASREQDFGRPVHLEP